LCWDIAIALNKKIKQKKSFLNKVWCFILFGIYEINKIYISAKLLQNIYQTTVSFKIILSKEQKRVICQLYINFAPSE